MSIIINIVHFTLNLLLPLLSLFLSSLLGVLEFSPTPLSFLPSFLSSSLSSKRAIYNQDTMEERDYSVLSHNQSVALVFGDLLSVSQELSLSLSQLHRGVAQDVCSLILREENSWIEFMKQFCDTNIMTVSGYVNGDLLLPLSPPLTRFLFCPLCLLFFLPSCPSLSPHHLFLSYCSPLFHIFIFISVSIQLLKS